MRPLLAVALLLSLPHPARADCAEKARQLKARLAALKPAPPLLLPTAFASEAPRTALGQPVREAGSVVGFSGTTFSLDGVLRTQEQLRAALKKSRPRFLYLAAGSALPARSLSEVAALAAGAELRLLVMPAQDPKDVARLYEDLAAASNSCRPLRNALAESDRVLPERKWMVMRERVPQAVLECRCEGVEPDKLAAVLAKLSDPASQPVRFQALKFSPQGRDLALSPGASLAQLLEALWLLPPSERLKPLKL